MLGFPWRSSVLRLSTPNARDPSSIPGQRTRFHIAQLKSSHFITKMEERLHVLQSRPSTAKEININIYFLNKEGELC